jgi:hypothetical protein
LVVEDIYKDLHRTLPSHSLLKSDSGRASLQRVLTAFAIHNPLIGYCQGLNFIAGALLTVMPTESMAFSIMARLIGRRMCCYTRSMCGTLVDARVLNDLLSFHEPKLHTLLVKNGVAVMSLSTSWLLCMFVQSPLKVEDAIRFWDVFLLHSSTHSHGMRVPFLGGSCCLISIVGSENRPLVVICNGINDITML